MSHWNLHVTIGNKDKKIVRGVVTNARSKMAFVKCKTRRRQELFS